MPEPQPPQEDYTFEGYRNADGSVGTKNLLGITTSVHCMADVVNYVVKIIERNLLPKYPSIDGVVDTGLGPGASVALLAAPLVGATAFYTADYGTGLAYFGIVDPAVPRPPAHGYTFARRIMSAVELMPGHARSQVLTYASVHDLRVVGGERQLKVHLGQDVLAVDFDEQGRIVSIRGSLGAAPLQ